MRHWAVIVVVLFFLVRRPPPTSTLFPYTTLFRSRSERGGRAHGRAPPVEGGEGGEAEPGLVPQEDQIDRKSTRLNSSHLGISYAVFCLKKKKTTQTCLEAHRKLSRIVVRARTAKT